MAGKTTQKRKPAAPTAAKRLAAKPKSKAKSAPRKAAPAKPARAKPAPAASTTPAASVPGMILALGDGARALPGCGFGIDQSVLLGSIRVKLPKAIDFASIEPLLEEFALNPPAAADPNAANSPEVFLVGRIAAWQGAIQRGANVPVFGRARLWDRGEGVGGVHEIGFAVPSHARGATLSAIQFVIEAVLALAPAAANGEAALPALRQRFVALRHALARHALLGINAMHFVEAAHALGIERAPWAEQLWAYGMGRHRLLLNSSVTSATPHIGVAVAKDKLKCSAVLRAAGIPVARSGFAQNADTAAKIAEQIGYPVVVKPADMDQGAGVTAGIEDEADLRKAFEAAAKVSKKVMVEKHHFGRDYRVTVLNGQVIKIMDRRAGGVTGDGRHTIAELVEQANERDRAMRGRLGRQRAPMVLDEEADKLLAARKLTAASVLPDGEFVALRRRANISAGGTYEILPPETLHADNRMLAVNAAVALGLDLAGIDIISGDPAKSWRETGGIICEVNAQPQIGYRDTEGIFGEILLALMGGKGEIPVHLLVTQDGIDLAAPLPQVAASAKCNAAAWGVNGWIEGAGALGPFANAYRAGRGILLDPRVSAALIAMTEHDVLRFGIPAARFASIRLIGEATWQPAPALQQLIGGHASRIVRQQAGRAAGAAA